MIRLLAYFVLLIPVTYGALWLAEHPGEVMVEWQGYEIRMALGILVGMVFFGTVIVLMSTLIIRSILYTPYHLRQKHKIRRYEQGLQSLTQTMTALALGDFSDADRHLRKSRHFLKGDQPATHLLDVQLHHAKGETSEARATLEKMLESDATRPVALRGKIMALMQAREYVHARDFTEEAWRKRPHDRWLCQQLLHILFHARDWPAVEPVIQTAQRKGAITREQAGHFKAIMHVARGVELFEAASYQRAQERAEYAIKEEHDNLPARLLAAEALARQQQVRPMLRIIEQSWAIMPHPAFADLFIQHACDESASKTQKRLMRLADKNPDHLETRLLEARVYLQLSEFDKARNALKVALSNSEHAQTYELFAQLETAEHGDDKKAAHWLTQALHAPRNRQWLCHHCGETHTHWQTHCRHCDTFDSINWAQPDAVRTQDVPRIQAFS